jgi:hypothetical protein
LDKIRTSTTLEAFGSSINLDASKVLNFPSLIFLCGGPIKAADGAQTSLRSLFYERLQLDKPELTKKVLLAEEANNWPKMERHYDHLFALEDDLAYLSAVIMLFVESPGSLAELGAFSHDKVLSKKLMAVLEYSYQNGRSFIQDGPVALLKQQNPRSVLFYPWLGQPNEHGVRPLDRDEAKNTVNLLLEDLLKVMSRVPKEEKFDSGDRGHRILLIADFIKLGVIVKLSEIASLLAAAGLKLMGSRLERYLFLLEKLQLIEKREYGNNTYYVSPGIPNQYVRYARMSKSQTPDRMRLRSDLSDALQPLDRDRSKALEAYLKEMEARHG